MRSRSNLLIAGGLLIFPVLWCALVLGQAAYFGPMRSAFEKIGRRYLDDLPLGWGLFDVLYYTMPFATLTLIALAYAIDPGRNRAYLYLGTAGGVFMILVTRTWGPGYL